ncbi:MAG: replicative DNA helicase [Christensenellaceae bacterium]|jgi:replicative DNA helicase|nr:replicative DNA helicase [Christensenellaceae bacterium]
MEKKRTAARMMPHNIEAEQAVLGCNLIDNEASIGVMMRLGATDFYTEAHKTIFDAMEHIYNAHNPIDFVTLTDELERMGTMDAVGGIDYITTLTNIVPGAANVDNYVDIVKRDSVFRNLIKASNQIIDKAYTNEEKNNVIAFAEKCIFDIAQSDELSSLEQIERPLQDVIAKLDMVSRDKNALRGVSTGFKELDKITRGLQNSDLILLAARPGVGKTSFAMNIINHAALNHKKKCAVFTLEMPKTQIAQRSLFSVAGISMTKGLNGELTKDDWKALWTANKKLSEAGIYIDDSSGSTPVDILSKCRWLKLKYGLDLVMIDYLQLMNGMSRNKENRQQEISELTRNLKIAARELNVPIILLSQLSRALESRKDHKPQLSDLRESGAIEQDADIVLFLYNPDKHNDVVSEDPPGVCELIIAKHRNGETGTVKLRWIGEITSFKDVDSRAEPQKYIPKAEDIPPPPEDPLPPPPPVPEEIDDIF